MIYKVKNIRTGKYLTRTKVCNFSSNGDFFNNLDTAVKQRDRANPHTADILKIVSFSILEI